jgi:hypothetical protein
LLFFQRGLQNKGSAERDCPRPLCLGWLAINIFDMLLVRKVGRLYTLTWC